MSRIDTVVEGFDWSPRRVKCQYNIVVVGFPENQTFTSEEAEVPLSHLTAGIDGLDSYSQEVFKGIVTELAKLEGAHSDPDLRVEIYLSMNGDAHTSKPARTYKLKRLMDASGALAALLYNTATYEARKQWDNRAR